jgi:cysteine desulfurase
MNAYADVPRAYLDNAATTPMSEEAIAAMVPYLSEHFANPSSSHAQARAVRRALDDAREDLGDVLGCHPDEIVFTSGGTEADNLAVFGVARSRPGEILVSSIEHKAVLEPAREVGARLIPVMHDGTVDLGALDGLLGSTTSLVSVMTVNNEIGIIEPLGDVLNHVQHKSPDALIHTDAVQGFPWSDLKDLARDCDLVTVSAHKFGGPKGIGALVVRARARALLSATHVGGGQERGMRAGTENVAGIVSMACAARICAERRCETTKRIGLLRDVLVDGVLAGYPRAFECAPRERRIAGNAHLMFPGIEAEEMLIALDRAGVSCSAGSACASGAIEPSHVLIALGYSPALARSAVRFSLAATTTKAEVDLALSVVPEVLARLGAPLEARD